LIARRSRRETGICEYEELAYRELWPGVDNAGANGLSVGSEGGLTIHTPLGEPDARPVSYQRVAGTRFLVDSSYALQDADESGYGFTLDSDYDRRRPPSSIPDSPTRPSWAERAATPAVRSRSMLTAVPT
jgi:hypothetical protein